MPDVTTIRLYMFDGLPLYTDLREERDLLHTYVYTQLRLARRAWLKKFGRDPRYLVYVEGVGFASAATARCRGCDNERARIGELLVCQCAQHASLMN